MPYLANGLYFIFQTGTSSLYDPKEMIPMTFMGEFWRLPVIVITPLAILFLAFNIIRLMVILPRYGLKKVIVYNLLFTLLSLGSFFITPHYFYWLFD
jgi:hypothetical protein